MKRLKLPLFKLWVLTTVLFTALSAQTFGAAYTAQVFLSNLRDARFDHLPLQIYPSPNDLILRLTYYIEFMLQDDDDVIRHLMVPYACDASDGGPTCWGRVQEVRRLLERRADERKDDPLAVAMGEADVERIKRLTDREIIQRQYYALELWRDTAVLTKVGIALELGLVCLRGPLIALLVGWALLTVLPRLRAR